MNSTRSQSLAKLNPLPPHFQPGLLTDAELLGRILYPGKQKGRQRAEDLLQSFGGLRGLQIASRLNTDERQGLDDKTAILIQLTYELVNRQLKQSLKTLRRSSARCTVESTRQLHRCRVGTTWDFARL